MSAASNDDFDPTRRRTLKWLMLVAAALGVSRSFSSAAQVHWRSGEGQGYGTDPDLLKPPTQPWPLTLTAAQRAVAAVVLDVILPADAGAPAASAVGLVDFLDEWVSAPYPLQKSDATKLVPLLDAI